MLLLMTFLERDTNNDALRTYQRDRWGRLSGGETCVIELSGLAANSLKAPIDHKLFRQKRVDLIRQRIRTYKPSLIVMYGVSEQRHWQNIVDDDDTFLPDVILSRPPTILVFASHPTKHGATNAYWSELGERLRQTAIRAGAQT